MPRCEKHTKLTVDEPLIEVAAILAQAYLRLKLRRAQSAPQSEKVLDDVAPRAMVGLEKVEPPEKKKGR